MRRVAPKLFPYFGSSCARVIGHSGTSLRKTAAKRGRYRLASEDVRRHAAIFSAWKRGALASSLLTAGFSLFPLPPQRR